MLELGKIPLRSILIVGQMRNSFLLSRRCRRHSPFLRRGQSILGRISRLVDSVEVA